MHQLRNITLIKIAYASKYRKNSRSISTKNNNYSDLFSENLIGQSICSFQKLKEYLNDEDKRGALLMPTDAEVKEALQRNDFKKDATLLLYLMESKINPNFTNSTFNNGFIEFGVEPLIPIKYD